MRMKVAKYISEFFVKQGVTDMFMITGGAAMHRRQRGRDRQCSAAGGHPDPREVPVLRSAELEGL